MVGSRRAFATPNPKINPNSNPNPNPNLNPSPEEPMLTLILTQQQAIDAVLEPAHSWQRMRVSVAL